MPDLIYWVFPVLGLIALFCIVSAILVDFLDRLRALLKRK